MPTFVDDRVEGSARFFTRICEAAVSAVRADAAGLSLLGLRTGAAITFSDGLPTDDLQQRLDRVEQGPGHYAAAHDCLVLIADLAELEPMTRFPDYAAIALIGCVRSVSVIPLGTAAARLGTLEFYRYWPQALAEEELDVAVTFAAMITEVLCAGPGPRHGGVHWPVDVQTQEAPPSPGLSARVATPSRHRWKPDWIS
ncbi:hypothetical protein Rhe02_16620 [Rhizocola hellebori]|uniref:GAF domain-containing protein n=1 Tax=Rhizocola hellebori TaxID=1392758 RepID=A0A8J3VEI8_9ACTN|nr:hypothetical protein [Rhizocola hellebori]GIH03595.1 hypothetical protein Rhe02_16620 [Rhizocola hellebori]